MNSDLYLVLTFKTSSATNYSIVIKNVKDNLAEDTIISAMDAIVNSGIFQSKQGSLVSKVKADIVTKKTQTYKMA